MAKKKITELETISNAQDNDLLIVQKSDDSGTFTIKYADLLSQATGISLSGDISSNAILQTGEDLEIFNKMLAMLDEIEDVQNVYHNVEL